MEDTMWTVSWRQNFSGDQPEDAEPGEEISVRRAFLWENAIYRIPAVYCCREGLVIDVIRQVEPEVEEAFLKKWGIIAVNDWENNFSEEQWNQLCQEDPLRMQLRAFALANGQQLTQETGSFISWNPCNDEANSDAVRRVVEQYELDPAMGWSIQRMGFGWNGQELDLQKLSLTFIREMRAEDESVPPAIEVPLLEAAE